MSILSHLRKRKLKTRQNTVDFIIEIDCVEHCPLRIILDDFVNTTAERESASYLAQSSEYEYWRDVHALAVRLRNKFSNEKACGRFRCKCSEVRE